MINPKFLLLAFAGVACPAAVAQTAPDAHIVRPMRGDVLVVDGQLEPGDGVRRPRYVAPVRGWRYSPLQPGQRLRPAFYGPRYVVAAPARLPAARGTQRWIRYGTDLVLVDARNGRVVRVAAGRG